MASSSLILKKQLTFEWVIGFFGLRAGRTSEWKECGALGPIGAYRIPRSPRAEEQAIKFVSRGLDEASSMSHRISPHILPEPPHFVSSMLISARATPKIAGYTSHVAPGELVWD
ncbi:hypothetical protein QC763_0026980 [Podospora pseudopauciseta]|uniref:Uncharacterized protein n=2 Tax=Podospora TaxID=5144 RepID=A0ABR0I2U2_9PEZI|nr:hypothetical protein QC763_0026980 [Podospora pseudopauciseta]KAK4683188.1 hypothetical protein QC764_0026880 [Podospora pseudoanserina]